MTSTARASNRWTPRTAAAAAFALLFLALQVGVPLVRLFGPRPARFGWQMYAATTPLPTLVGVRADGGRDTLAVGDYFAFLRSDLAPSAFERLPRHVCTVVPGLRAVEYQGLTGSPRLVPCR